jgi:hypothetical protein
MVWPYLRGKAWRRDRGAATYGASVADVYRQAGIYSGKILAGVKAVDLPVELR